MTITEAVAPRAAALERIVGPERSERKLYSRDSPLQRHRAELDSMVARHVAEIMAIEPPTFDEYRRRERRKRASTMFEYLRVLMEGWSK